MRFTVGWCPRSQTELPLHSHVAHPLPELEPPVVNLLHRVKIARQQVHLKSQVVKCFKRLRTWSRHLLLEVIFDAALSPPVAFIQRLLSREWSLKILTEKRFERNFSWQVTLSYTLNSGNEKKNPESTSAKLRFTSPPKKWFKIAPFTINAEPKTNQPINWKIIRILCDVFVTFFQLTFTVAIV